jgi:hypothetical protein
MPRWTTARGGSEFPEGEPQAHPQVGNAVVKGEFAAALAAFATARVSGNKAREPGVRHESQSFGVDLT